MQSSSAFILDWQEETIINTWKFININTAQTLAVRFRVFRVTWQLLVQWSCLLWRSRCSNGTDHQGSRLDSFSKKTSHCGSKGSSGHGRHTRYTFRSSASQPSSVCSSPYRDHTERSPVLRAIRSDNPHPDDDRTRKQVWCPWRTVLLPVTTNFLPPYCLNVLYCLAARTAGTAVVQWQTVMERMPQTWLTHTLLVNKLTVRHWTLSVWH